MGKRKFGTVIDPQQLSELKLVAAREGKKISEVVAEALAQYLRGKAGSVVEQTRGAIPAPPDVVRAVLEEEDDLLDS